MPWHALAVVAIIASAAQGAAAVTLGGVFDPNVPLITEEPVDESTVLTSRLGSTFAPASTLAAQAWTDLTSRTFRYPEQQLLGQWGIPRLLATPDVGIALGGGGLRAAAFADGWMRGLFMVRGARPVTLTCGIAV